MSRSEVLRRDTVIRLKAQELASHILGRRAEVNFDEPTPELNRIDSVAVRKMILSLKTSDARKLGLGKSTLHYLRENTRSGRTFMVYGKVRRKLDRRCSPEPAGSR
jgi:CRISPR-associated protein Cas1